LLLVLVCAAGCQAPKGQGRPSWERLQTGRWVEAEGKIAGGRPLTSEIDEKEDPGSDRPERYEVTGPVEAFDAGRRTLTLLDHSFAITDKTSYEDADKNDVEPFDIESGDWIKVKAVLEPSGECRARVIRSVSSAKRFEVEGVVNETRAEPPAVRIGGIWLDLEAGTDVTYIKVKKPRAEEILEDTKSPLTLFQEDDQKGARFSFRPSDNLFIGGQLVLEGRARNEYDLNRERDRDDTRVQEEVKADVLWGMADNGSFVLLEVAATREDEFRDDRKNETEDGIQITRAYGYWVLDEKSRLQVGRQDFDEEREWLYDDRLDGARIHYNGSPMEFEFSLSSGRKVLANKNNGEDTISFISMARYRIEKDFHLSAYVIDRRDGGDADFSPLHYGLRSFNRPRKGLRHWIELSRATGDDGDREIDGYGFDAGLTYAFDHDLRPAVTVGWALGTGDRHPDDDQSPFRQTGLQDNNAKFGGVTSFRYYGELFDPELSNLEVTTLGVGFRPVKDASVDLVAHTYRQDWASDEKGINNLKRSPNGESRNIGWEMDMIFGYRWEKTLNVELVLAHFNPGRAYDERDSAFLANVQLRFRF
jgi:alginate production protein